jgi:antitoxin VapB
MRKPRTTKAFKSGNSIAVRLPARFGVKPGTEMRVREEQGRYVIEPVAAEPEEKDWSRLWALIGSCPDLEPLAPEDRVFDDSPRDWHVLDGPHD